jgi:EAL domain-containing protein (putative c-di-GMP-specific phosphodiesterase class I)
MPVVFLDGGAAHTRGAGSVREANLTASRSQKKRALPPGNPGEMGFAFSFAFQPIVDARRREVISYEALVRGPHGESAASVLAQVRGDQVRRFDGACLRKAIQLASRLHLPGRMNFNLAAQSIYDMNLSITATFQQQPAGGLRKEDVVFELLETERLSERENLVQTLRHMHALGFNTAIDDFGAGYSGLKLLVDYQPYYIKLDRHLIGDITHNKVKQRIFCGIRKICTSLGIEIVAEGVETAAEYRWLYHSGVGIFQGYYFARPAFEALPDVAECLFAL